MLSELKTLQRLCNTAKNTSKDINSEQNIESHSAHSKSFCMVITQWP